MRACILLCKLSPLLLAPLVGGCFAGTVGAALGLASATSDNGGGSSEALRAVNLRVLEGTPGAGRADDLTNVRIAFDLVGPHEKRASVKVELSADRLDATIAELDLDASAAGQPHMVVWNAAADGLRGFQSADIHVTPRDDKGNGFPAALEGIHIGNDPPAADAVEVVRTGQEESVSGNVVIRFHLADTSGDPSRVVLRLLRPGESGSTVIPAPHILTGLSEKLPPGTHAITWDSEATLGKSDLSDLVISIVPDDELAGGQGAPSDSTPFRVDNNDPPVSFLNGGAFVLGQDETRGVPAPFELDDPEGDPLLAVFQWKLAGQQEFPELPRTRSGIESVLGSPEERRRLQIASEIPRIFAGTIEKVAAGETMRIRLPETASSAGALLAGGLVGREIELVGPRAMAVRVLQPTGQSSPVAAAPAPGGESVYVLDRALPGQWRLVEAAHSTGRVLRTIVPRPGAALARGNATALALEPGGKSALVALELVQIWWVARVSLEDGAQQLLAQAGPSTPFGPVRAIAPLGRGAALMTIGNALVRLEYPESAADTTSPRRASVQLNGLEEPWGIAVDPLRPHRVYVSERSWRNGAAVGRVLEIDLTTGGRSVLPAGGAGWSSPTGLALEGQGSRLLAVTVSVAGGKYDVRALDLGAASGEPYVIDAGLAGVLTESGSGGGIATGPGGLRVVALPGAGAFAAGGGVAQRRRIVQFEPSSRDATLDRPFEPAPEAGDRWRIVDRMERERISKTGVFVWDTSDASQAGEAVLRLTPYDTERGRASDSGIPRRITAPLQVEPEILPLSDSPSGLALHDLNGDGRLDIAAGGEINRISCLFQREQGRFGRSDFLPGDETCAPIPDAELGRAASTRSPRSIAVSDLDGDGDADVACANNEGNSLAIFLQGSPGTYGVEAAGGARDPDVLLGGAQSTRGPEGIVAADIDGDGLTDLVSANLGGDDLSVFFQRTAAPGQAAGARWSAAPDVTLGRRLDDGGSTHGPVGAAAGDLDGDGDLDLAIACLDSSDIALYYQGSARILGKSGASAAREPDAVLGGPGVMLEPRAALAVDLDGDGRLDLAVACQGGAQFAGAGLVLFIQGGAGGFREPVALRSPDGIGSPFALSAADFDGNGAFDLVAANFKGNNLALLFQKPGGRFGVESESGGILPDLTLGGAPTTSGPKSIGAADLDGDGLVDFVAANKTSRSLTAFLQRSATSAWRQGCIPGSSTEPQVRLGSSSATRNPVSLAAADLDGDGSLDLVTANGEGESLTMFFQTTPRAFEQAGPIPRSAPLFEPSSVSCADIDGDGRVEMLAANPTGGDARIFRLRLPAEGPTLVETVLGGAEASPSLRDARAADLDGDGRLDVAAALPDQDSIAIFHQREPWDLSGQGGPAAGEPTLRLGAGSIRKPVSLALADFDGDGRADIASANQGVADVGNDAYSLGSYAVFFQNGGGAFEAVHLPGAAGTARGPVSIAATDIDLDGDLDFAAACIGGDVEVYTQTGPRRFARVPSSPVLRPRGDTTGPVSIAVSDLDGDGRADLLAASTFSSDLSAFLARRPGVFAPAPDFTLGGVSVTTGPACVLAVDIDGDSDVDIISANSRTPGESVTIFVGGR